MLALEPDLPPPDVVALLTRIEPGEERLGHVGQHLIRLLLAHEAEVIAADIDADKCRQFCRDLGCRQVEAPEILEVDCEVLSPCAMGGVLNDETIERLKCGIVAGSANNQLLKVILGRRLKERGILYAPDYVVNGGGIINVASELNARNSGGAYDPAWVEGKLSRLMETLEEVLDRSEAEKRPTHQIADAIAEARINAARAEKAEQRKAA